MPDWALRILLVAANAVAAALTDQLGGNEDANEENSSATAD